MPKITITITYETDTLDGKRDHMGIAESVDRAFPDLARPYVSLKGHEITLKLPGDATRWGRRRQR